MRLLFHTAMGLLLWIPCCLWSSDIRLRKASYLYELEGNSYEALELIHEVLSSPNIQDRTEARILMGRIHEWNQVTDSATWYYQQALDSTPHQSLSTVQFLAERIATLRNTPPKILLQDIPFPSTPLYPVAGSQRDPIFFLSNQKLWNPHHPHRIIEVNSDYKPLLVHQGKHWFEQNDQLQLIIRNGPYPGQSRSIPLNSKVVHALALNDQHILIQTLTHIHLFLGEKEILKIPNSLPDCLPLLEYTPIQQIFFSCPDNALHPINIKDGHPQPAIGLLETIDTAFAMDHGIAIINHNGVWFYEPHKNNQALWQKSFTNIHSAAQFHQHLALLEADGTLTLLEQKTGKVLVRTPLEPGQLFVTPFQLGLISHDGDLIMLDRQGKEQWRYQSGQQTLFKPFYHQGRIYVPQQNEHLLILNGRYFGEPQSLNQKLWIQSLIKYQQDQLDLSRSYTDSLLKIEPGHAGAWAQKAKLVDTDSIPQDSVLNLWAQAARFSRGVSATDQKDILSQFAKVLGANWIQALPRSSQTYPQLFGWENDLCTIDAGSRSVVCLNQTNGHFKWRTSTLPLTKNYQTTYYQNILAIGSDFSISIHDLKRKGRRIHQLDLPGKVYQMQMTSQGLLVSTWNGFLLLYQKKDFQSLWTKRLGNSGHEISLADSLTYALSSTGNLRLLKTRTGNLLQEHLIEESAYQLVATPRGPLVSHNGKITLFDLTTLNALWRQTLGNQIFSMQSLQKDGKDLALIGLANQSLVMLDIQHGKTLWSWQGHNSLYIRPQIADQKLFIDQSTSLQVLDLLTGTPLHSWKIPGSIGPIWWKHKQIFCSTPHGFLLSFPDH